jgi:hypothetical protein
MTKFDPIAVGKEIAGHVADCDNAKAQVGEHAEAAGRLLLDAKENHSDDFEAVCKAAKLHKSRVYELMQIAGGRKTSEQVKAATKNRVKKHRAKKKISKTKPSVTSDGLTDDALAEFKEAVHHWIPEMDSEDRAEAVEYVNRYVGDLAKRKAA